MICTKKNINIILKYIILIILFIVILKVLGVYNCVEKYSTMIKPFAKNKTLEYNRVNLSDIKFYFLTMKNKLT